MAVLFGEHTTAVQPEAAFRASGRRLNKRLELRTFLPWLQFVSAGLCRMVCDMTTAHTMLSTAAPRTSSGVSILTPGYATQSLAARAFITVLEEAVTRMPQEIEAALTAP